MAKEQTKLKPIDAQVYGYWSAIYRSFYSKRLFVDVGKRWRGLGILYLLLVVAIFSIPYYLRIVTNVQNSFKEQLIDPMLQIPVFYIQNGEISFDKPMPYRIKNDKGQVVAVIDSTGKINDFSGYPYLTILINKDKISIRVPRPQFFMVTDSQPNNSTPLVQTFDKGTNMVFDSKQLVKDNSIVKLKYFSEIMIYPILASVFFAVFLIFFIVIGFLGQVFSSVFFSFQVSFARSVRLLIIASTPMLLVFFIVLSLNYIFSGLGFILLGLLIAYYCFAVYSLRAESKQVVIS